MWQQLHSHTCFACAWLNKTGFKAWCNRLWERRRREVWNHWLWSCLDVSVGLSTTLVQTEISHQLLDELRHNFAQTFKVPRGWIPLTYSFSDSLVKIFTYPVKYLNIYLLDWYKITGIHGSQRMNCNCFGDPLPFRLSHHQDKMLFIRTKCAFVYHQTWAIAWRTDVFSPELPPELKSGPT